MSTKLHLAVTLDGHVVDGFLTGGNKADISMADELTEEIFGCYVLEDKGYDSDKHRISLRDKGNIPVILGRRNRKEPIIYDEKLYKKRMSIERLFAKIKENRRLAMRFDKSDSVFLAFIALACIKFFL